MSEVKEEPLEVPHTALRAEILTAIIEEFVLREGTEYGAAEYSLPEKVAAVRAQLERGEAHITYDAISGGCTIRQSPGRGQRPSRGQ